MLKNKILSRCFLNDSLIGKKFSKFASKVNEKFENSVKTKFQDRLKAKRFKCFFKSDQKDTGRYGKWYKVIKI